MSRALFNDPDVAKRLKEDFVPAGTGTETLTTVDPAVLEWFAAMATRAIEKAGYIEEWKKNPYFQGMYVAGADGTAYVQVGDWDKKAFLKILDAALADFRRNPPKKIEITDAEVAKGEPPGPPKGTSIVRLYSRCTPLPKDAHPVNRSIGRDHLWIYADEVAEIEKTGALPAKVGKRLARFHLVDNVRGLADAWSAGEAKFAFELKRDGSSYRLTGTMSAAKGDLGMEGTLEAEFTIAKGRVSKFRGIFEGKAWGVNSNTWYAPKGKFPLVIAMIDVEEGAHPVWRDYGLDYDNPE